MSHTPGPWKVGLPSPDCCGSKDFPYIVILDYGVGPTEPNVMASRLSEANAHLIAAAPEMYEALKDVEWSHHGECPQCGRSQSLGHQPRCILGNALAKAEGRQ